MAKIPTAPFLAPTNPATATEGDPSLQRGGYHPRPMNLRQGRPPSSQGSGQSSVEIGRRLAEARRPRYATASEAARELGVAGPTYLAHENGTRGMRADMAEFYAQRFSVSTEWLLYGRGEKARDGVASSGVDPRAALNIARDVQRPAPSPGPARDARRELFSTPGGGLEALPTVTALDGYIPEVGPRSERGASTDHFRGISLDLPDGPTPPRAPLEVRDVHRMPLDAIPSERAVIVAVGRSDLATDLFKAHRLIVNPDGVSLEAGDSGLFVLRSQTGFVSMVATRLAGGQGYAVIGSARPGARSQTIPAERFERDVVGAVIGVLGEARSDTLDELTARLRSEVEGVGARRVVNG